MSKELKIKLFEPNKVQREMLEILYVKKPQIAVFDISRQVGKTYSMSIDGLYYAINNPKSKVLWISPTYENNARIFKDLYNLFDGHDELKGLLFEQIKFKEQEFVLKNGSIYSFRSSEQGDTLRGRSAHRIYVDEAAFIAESIVAEILLPMLTTTGGQLILTSTPNGRNWFYDWFQRGQPSSSKYDPKKLISLRRNYLDLNDPKVNKFAEMMKTVMTKMQFKREMLAEFITDDTLFDNVDECIGDYHIPEEGEQLFIGVDIGVSNDRTVVTVVNQDNKVVFIDAFNMRENDLTHKEFKDRIMYAYQRYFDKLVAMYIESNNMELLIDELYEEYENSYKMFPVSMQYDMKGKIIGNLRLLFDKKKIQIPNNDTLIAELYGYQSKRTISGKIQYQNKGVDHDDYVMSLALACYAAMEEFNAGFIESY